MAGTNVKTTAKPSTTKSSGTTSTTKSSSSTSHPVMLRFVVGFLLIIVAAWFSNISEDTGNAGAALFALLWIIWIMNNSSKLRSITP